MNVVETDILQIEQTLLERGFDRSEAALWYQNGFRAKHVRDWLKLGVQDPDTAFAIKSYGPGPALLLKAKQKRQRLRREGEI